MDLEIRKKLKTFRKQKRAYFSFVLLSVFFIVSLISEVFVNNKPIFLYYKHRLYFPVLKFYPQTEFGGSESSEPEYRNFCKTREFKEEGVCLMPLHPYSPYESIEADSPPPNRPTLQNPLGTDDRGRDLLARLLYGFRSSFFFALCAWVGITLLAYFLGALQGYFGGKIDIVGQRLGEIWSSLPVLYIIIFLISLFPPNLSLLLFIWIIFNWLSLSSYIRVDVLKVKQLDFVNSARSIGLSTWKILWKHIFPNTLTPIITFTPFILSSSIGALAALDYLGLGLPPPAASWGELLHQGKENLQSWWLVIYPFSALFLTLILLNFIGEGIRETFDVKR